MTTKIEWTQGDDGTPGMTWNPVSGCDRVSLGCDHCYAEAIANRFAGTKAFPDGFAVTLHPDRLEAPFAWRKPRRVFVNSMSDLFHPQIGDGYIARVWDVMGRTGQHTYQILTKRPQRMASWCQRWADHHEDQSYRMVRGPEATRLAHPSGRGQLFAAMLDTMGDPPAGCAYPTFDWMEGQRWWPETLPHVWLGASIETDQYSFRADHVRNTPAAVRFLSCEPLLGPLLNLDLAGIDWLIVGGESGPGARRMNLEWADDLVTRGRAAGTAVFVKQLGSAYRQKGDAKGGKPEYWPPELRVREWPKEAA